METITVTHYSKIVNVKQMIKTRHVFILSPELKMEIILHYMSVSDKCMFFSVKETMNEISQEIFPMRPENPYFSG